MQGRFFLKGFFLKTALLLCCLFLMTACASHTASSETAPPTPNVDPYEHYNRNTYRLNEKLDYIFLKPVAKAHKRFTPAFVRTGLTHFFNNITTISDIANDVLQLDFYWTMNDMWRLLLNSTLGVAGFFDVATTWFGLIPHDNNFSFTLQTWGAQPSPYVMLPMLGPKTIGDLYGLPLNFYLSPVGGLISVSAVTDIGWEMFSVGAINTKANYLDNEELVHQLALDPYIFIRNAYLQSQRQEFYINQHPPSRKKSIEEQAPDELYTE